MSQSDSLPDVALSKAGQRAMMDTERRKTFDASGRRLPEPAASFHVYCYQGERNGPETSFSVPFVTPP